MLSSLLFFFYLLQFVWNEKLIQREANLIESHFVWMIHSISCELVNVVQTVFEQGDRESTIPTISNYFNGKAFIAEQIFDKILKLFYSSIPNPNVVWHCHKITQSLLTYTHIISWEIRSRWLNRLHSLIVTVVDGDRALLFC